jgi:hypothetical protein
VPLAVPRKVPARDLASGRASLRLAQVQRRVTGIGHVWMSSARVRVALAQRLLPVPRLGKLRAHSLFRQGSK